MAQYYQQCLCLLYGLLLHYSYCCWFLILLLLPTHLFVCCHGFLYTMDYLLHSFSSLTYFLKMVNFSTSPVGFSIGQALSRWMAGATVSAFCACLGGAFWYCFSGVCCFCMGFARLSDCMALNYYLFFEAF